MKQISLRKNQKKIATVLLLLFLHSLIAPTATYALTSGPTQPEYTSFEPVNATDMVQLTTGDMLYNIPLFSIPSSNGEYPINIIYNNSGIKNNQEASMVGLGWNVNVGEINRSVEMFPDDISNYISQNYSYWEGGEVSSVATGFSIGISYMGILSVGYNNSSEVVSDTYKGTRNIENSGNFFSAGGSGYDNIIGIVDAKADPTVSSVTKRNSESMNRSMQLGNTGFTIFGGTWKNTISQRYFSNISTTSNNFGAIKLTDFYGSNINNCDYDSKMLLDYEANDIDVMFNNDNPTWVIGATSPCFDNYSISNNSIGGQIEPYLKDGIFIAKKNDYKKIPSSFMANTLVDVPITIFEIPSTTTKQFNFKFNNEITDYLIHSSTSGDPILSNNIISFENNLVYSKNNTNNRLNTPNFIEYYTNYQIANNNCPGLIKQKGYNYSGKKWEDRFDLSNQIGGFKVIDKNGYTYHYSLPVYTYNEIKYKEDKDAKDKLQIKLNYNPQPYAYVWLLSAITGPDYVDRGNPQICDGSDYGYWVNFEYGKWSDQYKWRTPYCGTEKTMDGGSMYDAGIKEIYYLDYIETTTHTAVFEKSLRHDGKSAATIQNHRGGAKRKFNTMHDNEAVGKPLINHFIRDKFDAPSGITPSNIVPTLLQSSIVDDNDNINAKFGAAYREYTSNPVSLLKLDNIYLVKNEDMIVNKSSNTNSDISFNKVWQNIKPPLSISYNNNISITYTTNTSFSNFYDLTENYKFNANEVFFQLVSGYSNVVDNSDNLSQIKSKSIRSVNFNYDYSLAPQTLNSFNETDVIPYYSSSLPITNYPKSVLKGKLTLKSIKFLGKSLLSVLPPISFEYDFNNPTSGNLDIDFTNNQLTTTNILNTGDILYLSSYDNGSYVLVTDNISAGVYRFKKVGQFDMTSNVNNIPFKVTKNPPYDINAFDDWGYYKCDYQFSEDYNSSKKTTLLSSKNIDAWGLRQIYLPTGGTLKFSYESDDYVCPQIYNGVNYYNFPIQELIPIPDVGSGSGPYVETSLNVRLYDSQLYKELLTIGQNIKMHVMFLSTNSCPGIPPAGTTNYLGNLSTDIHVKNHTFNANISSFNADGTINITFANSVNTFPYLRQLWGAYRKPLTAMLKVQLDNIQKGGGVRVKQIVSSDQNNVYTKDYDYHTTNVTSGCISFEPRGLSNIIFDKTILLDFNNCFIQGHNHDSQDKEAATKFEEKRKQLFADIYRDKAFQIAFAGELPAPLVSYSTVNVSNRGKNGEVLGKFSYSFNTFSLDNFKYFRGDNPNDIGYSSFANKGNIVNGYNWGKRVVEKDYSTIGALMKIEKFDNSNRLLGSKIFNFSSINNIERQYKQIRGVSSDGATMYTKAVSTTYKNKRGVLESIIENENGTSNIKTFLYDIDITGEPYISQSKNTYGQIIRNRTIPAYVKYPEMGSKVFDPNNKNMLSQTAATYTELSKDNGATWLPMAAGVQTWKKDWTYRKYDAGTGIYIDPSLSDPANGPGIYRVHQNWSWNGAVDNEGLLTGFVDFNWSNPLEATMDNVSGIVRGWVKNSEITRYDHFSHALEEKDRGGNYAAIKMDNNNQKVVITANNSSYVGIAYSGFEEDDNAIGIQGSEVFVRPTDNGYLDNTMGHTGKSCLIVAGFATLYKAPIYNGNATSATFLNTDIKGGRTYRASVWVHKDHYEKAQLGYKISTNVNDNLQTGATWSTYTNASADGAVIKAGDWYLVNMNISIPTNVAANSYILLGVAGQDICKFDDFRFHPIQSAATSYVYDPATDWVTHILGADNFYTRFEYDAMGRLIATYKETPSGEKLVSTTSYKYKAQ